jgi:hypothetical protein
MKEVYILVKDDVEEPYVYKKGEDPSVPYAFVDYGLKFSNHGDEVTLGHTRYAPGKATKYLTIGDYVSFSNNGNSLIGKIKEETMMEKDAWDWNDTFVITDVECPLHNLEGYEGLKKEYDDFARKRSDISALSIILTDLRCPCCDR